MELIIIAIIFIIYTYISVKDWQTGFISLELNIAIFVLSIIHAFLTKANLASIISCLAIFVLPFIIVEVIYQIFINKEKDDDKFLIGGGDIILFASMSLILNVFGMMLMFFMASVSSLVVANVLKKKKIHFAPFLEFGFLISYLFANSLYTGLFNLIIS